MEYVQQPVTNPRFPVYCDCCECQSDKVTMAYMLKNGGFNYLEITQKRHGKLHKIVIDLTAVQE